MSLVTSYRGTFTQEVRKGGIDGLLKLLRDKNAVILTDKAKSIVEEIILKQSNGYERIGDYYDSFADNGDLPFYIEWAKKSDEKILKSIIWKKDFNL